MDLILTDIEVRVLGCLMEKEMATPEYYPLSLNAATNACNQKNNREPITDYGEETVLRALDSLKAKGIVWQSSAGRVPKYGQNFTSRCNLINKEAALLCLLFLRGPQTMGELRNRAERLYVFPDLEAVEETLGSLEEHGYVAKLPRQVGRKESRYAHLAGGEPSNIEAITAKPERVRMVVEDQDEKITFLTNEVSLLREEVEELKKELLFFRKQFE